MACEKKTSRGNLIIHLKNKHTLKLKDIKYSGWIGVIDV